MLKPSKSCDSLDLEETILLLTEDDDSPFDHSLLLEQDLVLLSQALDKENKQ